MPWPDSYGQSVMDLNPNEDVVSLFLNGAKLIEQIDAISPISGDYKVDYDKDDIVMLFPLQMGDMIEAIVTKRADADSLDYIQRAEIDATNYGFVANDKETILIPDSKLPTVARMESAIEESMLVAADGKMVWEGDWLAKLYQPNMVVRDGPWLAICTAATTDRPTPTPIGGPVYAIDPVPAWTDQSDIISVASGHNYTFLEAGLVAQARVFVPNTTDMLFKIQVLDITGVPGVIYETETSALTINEWNVISMPKLVVVVGTKLRVQVLTTSLTDPVTGAILYSTFPTYWTANPQTWASIGGYLALGGAEQVGVASTAFGCELQFQAADVSANWDIMSYSGGVGGGVSTGGGGVTHIVSNDLPDNSQGEDGAIWMQRVNPV